MCCLALALVLTYSAIADSHQNLLFLPGIISTNAESKIMKVEFVKFFFAAFAYIIQRKHDVFRLRSVIISNNAVYLSNYLLNIS